VKSFLLRRTTSEANVIVYIRLHKINADRCNSHTLTEL